MTSCLSSSRVLLSYSALLSCSSPCRRLRSLWIASSAAELAAAERRVLSRVQAEYEQGMVSIGQGQHINTLHIARGAGRAAAASSSSTSSSLSSSPPPLSPPSPASPPLVLIHGFGAGLGLWYGQLDSLSRHQELYALDLLGCGRSSRPRFTARSTAEAEDWFVDSLERWRRALGIERMTLAGHSLGGYVAAVYALRHPDRVARLLLLSPVGLPERPADGSGGGGRGAAAALPLSTRLLYGLVRSLWSLGLTPNDFIKLSGPYGRRFVRGYVQQRFSTDGRPAAGAGAAAGAAAAGAGAAAGAAAAGAAAAGAGAAAGAAAAAAAASPHLMQTAASMTAAAEEVQGMDKEAVTEYLYQMLAGRSSAERALSLLLSPGAFALRPLCRRLPALAAASPSIPALFVYGQRDWTDFGSGLRTAEALTAAGGSAAALRVRAAGHQLFADNVSGFHAAVMAGMQLPGREAGQAARADWLSASRARYGQSLILDS